MSQYKAVTPSSKKNRDAVIFQSQTWTAGEQLVQTLSLPDWQHQWKKDLEKNMLGRPEKDIGPIEQFRSLKSFSDREIHDTLRKEVQVIMEAELSEIRKVIAELSERTEIRTHQPTKGDMIYMKVKSKLEEESNGKIAAIDLESEKVAGIGETLLDAYEHAKKATGRDKFFFKRIGSNNIHSI